MRWLKILISSFVGLIIIYMLGPRPDSIEYNLSLPLVPDINELDHYILQKESVHRLRKNNRARIVWAQETAKKITEYSIVYLHGFSASQEEGEPVHRNVARRLGYNLYLSRLAEHGIDTTDQLVNLTPKNYWESAKNALSIGTRLGKKVILMGTSTGASQALQLASAFPDRVAALVLYSPNIAINDNNAWLLNDPWGLQIARIVKQSKYHDPEDDRPIYKQYWNKPYRLEAIVALQEMLEATMNKKTFSKIKQPTLLLYYYKNEKEQDAVVKVSSMKQMFNDLATPSGLKKKLAVPNAGDHVIASIIKSKDIVTVEQETIAFLEKLRKPE